MAPDLDERRCASCQRSIRALHMETIERISPVEPFTKLSRGTPGRVHPFNGVATPQPPVGSYFSAADRTRAVEKNRALCGAWQTFDRRNNLRFIERHKKTLSV